MHLWILCWIKYSFGSKLEMKSASYFSFSNTQFPCWEANNGAAHRASQPFTLSQFAQGHVHWVNDAIQPSHPLSSSPALNLSQHQVFSSELALHIRWLKYWSFSFLITPSSEYSQFVSFKIDWFDLLAVQGTLKSLLQHHSLKSSVLQCSALLWSILHICH